MSESDVSDASDHNSSGEEEEENAKLNKFSSGEEDEDVEEEEDHSDHVDENENLAISEEKTQTSTALQIKSIPVKQETGNKKSSNSPILSPSNQIVAKHKPSTEVMVKNALTALNERTGSSVQAIKKYIKNNYEIVNEKLLVLLVYKYLKKSVAEGTVIQYKRSFKINAKIEKPKKPKKPITAKPTAERKTNEKKTASVKTKASSKEKVNEKTAPVSSKTSKKKEPEKSTKLVEPSISADPLKSKKSQPKSTKNSQLSTSSETDSNQTKPKTKTKRILYVDKESIISVKIPKKPNSKPKANSQATEEPSTSTASNGPSSSKQKIQKSKAQKTKK